MSIKLKGSTDGSVTLQAPADTSPTGTDKTLILPTSVGSANQFLKNGSTAGTLEYASIANSDLPALTSANMPAGTIVQRQIDNTYTEIQLNQQTHLNIFTSSTFNAKRANSRLHITCHVHHGKRVGGEHQFSVRLLRNYSTTVTAALSSNTAVHYDVIRQGQGEFHGFTAFHFYDEPNTTGNLTYTFQAARPNSNYPVVFFNYPSGNQAGSTMIIDEIAQ